MDNNENLEKKLDDITKQKEEADKMLLNIEIVMGLLLFIYYIGFLLISCLVETDECIRFAIIFPNVIVAILTAFYMLRIEQKAGYYECQKCHHKYVPTYSNVFWAPHLGRTRYMKCPECSEKSWQKKVIKM